MAGRERAHPGRQRPPLGGERPPLPPGLDLLWGRRQRGRRGPRPGLSVDSIVQAAIAVADAEGMEAVSMARVAQELGVTTMSLYRYVTSKEELLQLMWNASAQGAAELHLGGEGWRPKLRNWAIIQREAIDRHPWITQMPMAAPPVGPENMLFVERGLEALDGTGLADRDKLRVIGVLSSYTLSEARMAHDTARAAARAGAAAVSAQPVSAWTFDALLRELVDQRTYPRLYRIAWSTPTTGDKPGHDEYEDFLFGIDRILDGVQALIQQAQ